MFEMHLTEMTIGFGGRLEPTSRVRIPNLNSPLRDHLTQTFSSVTASRLVLRREYSTSFSSQLPQMKLASELGYGDEMCKLEVSRRKV